MKYFYTFLFSLSFFTFLQAQTAVVLQVDMNEVVMNEGIATDGIFVAGSFTEWGDGQLSMEDPQGDGVYELTVMLDAGTAMEYKFKNGDGGWEGLDNRSHTVSPDGPDILPLVCFNSADTCVGTGVVFQVDMNQQILGGGFDPVADSVTVAGSFNGWDASATKLSDDDMDGIYSASVEMMPDTIQYKFTKNGGNPWESVSGACINAGGNRESIVVQNTVLPAYCWESCEMCPSEAPDTVDVTLLFIDLTGRYDSIMFKGSYGGWNLDSGNDNGIDGDEVADDGTFSLRIKAVEGKSYEWGAVNGACANPDDAWLIDGPNRMFAVSDSGEVSGQIDFEKMAAGELINVTFRVDLSDEIMNSSGIFVSGNWELCAWSKNVVQMNQVGEDGLFTITAEALAGAQYQFKFFNGDAGDDNAEAQGSTVFIDEGCGVDDGFGNSNRLLDLSSAVGDTILPVFVFGSCTESGLSAINDLKLEGFKMFPNPNNGQLNITFEADGKQSYELSILDITGRVLQTSNEFDNGNLTLDISKLNTGLYLTKITDSTGKIRTDKLVVE